MPWVRQNGLDVESLLSEDTNMDAGELRKHFLSLSLLLAICLLCNGLPTKSSGTTPFVFDGNRVYAELTFVRPDGTRRTALAFVDLGAVHYPVRSAIQGAPTQPKQLSHLSSW
jgi:hypothetical protein